MSNQAQRQTILLIMVGTIILVTACGLPALTSTDDPSATSPGNLSDGTPSIASDPVWSVVAHESNNLSISAMTLDHDEVLWTTGHGGVVRWDLDTGNYELFRHSDGMPGYSGRDILTDAQGGIWVRWAHPTYRGYGVSHYSQGSWTHYNASDGLADDIVNDMVVASDDRIWFSTPSGISSFDGGTWTTYTTADGLPSNDVGVIAAGQNGSIWVHTDEGAASFDGAEWSAHDYNPLKSVNVNDIIVAPNGWVWFATSRYFISYDGLEFDWHWTDEGARGYDQFTITRDGTLWARAGRGIAAWRNNQWYVILEESGLGTYGAKGLLAADDGTLWLTTSSDGLLRLSDWEFYASGGFSLLTRRYCESGIGVAPGDRFSMSDLEEETCLDEDAYFGDGLQTSDGYLIFRSGNRGFMAITQDGQYRRASLPESESTFLLEPSPAHRTYGADRSIWLYRGSIHQFDGQTWQDLGANDPRFDDVAVVRTGPDGRAWFGSEKTLAVWDGQSWTHWTAFEHDEDIDVTSIEFYGDDVWVVDSLRGISRLVGGQLHDPEWVTLDLPEWDRDQHTLGRSFLIADSHGGLWASGKTAWDGGNILAYYDGNVWQEYHLDEYEEIHLSAMAVAPDDSLWIGFRDDLGLDSDKVETIYEPHLLRFDGDQWQSLGTGEAFPEERAMRILFAQDGSVWIAIFGHGVVRFDADLESWEAFNTSNIFVNSDNVLEMFFDDIGALWIRLGDGYARYGPPLSDVD